MALEHEYNGVLLSPLASVVWGANLKIFHRMFLCWQKHGMEFFSAEELQTI